MTTKYILTIAEMRDTLAYLYESGLVATEEQRKHASQCLCAAIRILEQSQARVAGIPRRGSR